MDDLISRQATIYNLANIAKNCAKSDKQKALIGRCIYMIESMPSVQPEQKTGYWFDVGSLSCRCSVCGEIAHDRPYGSLKREPKKYCKMKYCPHCGAKMESEKE